MFAMYFVGSPVRPEMSSIQSNHRGATNCKDAEDLFGWSRVERQRRDSIQIFRRYSICLVIVDKSRDLSISCDGTRTESAYGLTFFSVSVAERFKSIYENE